MEDKLNKLLKDPHAVRGMQWYEEKNEFLSNVKERESGLPHFRKLDTMSFLHLIFSRGEGDSMLPFEESWCEAYEWWTEHPRSAKRPPEMKYVYNGIAQAIHKKGSDEKNKSFVITSNAEKLFEIKKHPFVIISPVSYTGKRRLKNNARYLYAMAIDIDDVDAENIDNLLYQSDPVRAKRGVNLTFPQPNIIVNSGYGIHIYYLLETPSPMFADTYKILNKVKKELTRRVWNRGTTHKDANKPQYQGNCQGFRLPGTQTKLYTEVTAWQNISKYVKPYYTVEDLAYNGGGWLTDEERDLLRKGTYKPNRCTLKEARELWPEWYERRIIEGHRPNRWYVKRDLYDWWKRTFPDYCRVGHRYFCMMALAIYAAKCNIPEEEFRSDLEYFTELLDGLSYTRNAEDRFTMEDAEDAAAAYNENYCTFPMTDIRDITGVPIERNQTRKGRNKFEHLKRASLVRNGLYADWTIGRGRKSKQEIIFQWKSKHPDGSKYACSKELGVDKKTVMKWWDTTAEDIQRAKEEREKLMASKVFTAVPTTEEPHGLGANVNSDYITSKKVAAATMQHTDGYEKHSVETINSTHDELSDAINFGALNIEKMMKAMGVPEFLIPMMKAEFEKQMQTPEFWEKYKKTNPKVDMSKWPPQMREAYEEAIEEHNKKK